MCVCLHARVFTQKAGISLSEMPPAAFKLCGAGERVFPLFFCKFATSLPFFFLFVFWKSFIHFFFPIKTHRSICALVVYFHHKTHALTPPHEEQNDDDDFNLFCYHYFSASDGWHGLDADDFLFDDGDDDEEDELLLEKDEYDQTTTKPPPTNRRGSRWE